MDKFFNWVEKTETCWIWKGTITREHGVLRRKGKNYQAQAYIFIHHHGPLPLRSRIKQELAHRYAFTQYIGPIPEGQCLLHKCDNPPCCNPKHLFLGTKAENAKDRNLKGRTAKGEQITINKRIPRGEELASKLTENDVREIRALLELGVPCTRIAKRYKVGNTAISNIKHRKKWKHVT